MWRTLRAAMRGPVVSQAMKQQAPRWWTRAAFAGASGFAAAQMWCPPTGALAQTAGADTESGEDVIQVSSVRRRQSITGNWEAFKVIDITDISHDTRIYRFALKNPTEEYHVGTTCTLQVSFWDWNVDSNPQVWRSYTPITPVGTKGYFDLMVKLYPEGFITEKMWKLNVGDKVKIRRQQLKLTYKANKWESINMIAGGVGITPMLQIIRTALGNPDDNTKVRLLFCNKTIEDILMAHELKTLKALHPDRFELTFMVDDKQSLNFDGEEGRVSQKLIHKLFPNPTKDVTKHLMCVCGPDGMLNAVAGVPFAHMNFWSHKKDQVGGKKAVRQPGLPDANNLADVGGFLANLGWQRNNTYCF